jgi:hypothetical protein
MHSITLKSHIGSNGLLQVHLPDMRDTDIEVVIVYQTSLSKRLKLQLFHSFMDAFRMTHFSDTINLNKLSAKAWNEISS